MNFNKSKALNISLSADTLTKAKQTCSFRWVTKALNYLRIWITPQLADLYKQNYLDIDPQIRKRPQNLEHKTILLVWQSSYS